MLKYSKSEDGIEQGSSVSGILQHSQLTAVIAMSASDVVEQTQKRLAVLRLKVT